MNESDQVVRRYLERIAALHQEESEADDLDDRIGIRYRIRQEQESLGRFVSENAWGLLICASWPPGHANDPRLGSGAAIQPGELDEWVIRELAASSPHPKEIP